MGLIEFLGTDINIICCSLETAFGPQMMLKPCQMVVHVCSLFAY